MFIRAATRSDAEAMAGVTAVVAEEGSIATEPPVDIEARAQQFREALDSGSATMWVTEHDGRVVGTAGAHPTGPPGVLSVGMMLLPEARGRGAGRAMLDAIVAHARESGAHKVELEVWPDNARAIALYARAGFQVEGLRRNHYRRRDGSTRSALLMACLLGERLP